MTTGSERDTHVVTATADQSGTRLDRLLAAALPALSRTRLKSLIEGGHVGAGGATITEPSYRVKPGEAFRVEVPPAVDATPAPQAIALDVVFEDDDLLVVDKPAGLVVHPAPGNPDGTLVNALLAHCGDGLSGIGGVRRPGIVHRLDKETSGLMVVAKNDTAHTALSAAFKDREITRVYHALVWGRPAQARGEIEGAIGRNPRNRKKMAVVDRGGKPALTRYRRIRPVGRAVTLVECRLATGRTHQIRVHMASIGHPVVGDASYGGGVTAARRALLSADGLAAVRDLRRHALHAGTIGFKHPKTGKKMSFERPFPNDLNKLCELLEAI